MDLIIYIILRRTQNIIFLNCHHTLACIVGGCIHYIPFKIKCFFNSFFHFFFVRLLFALMNRTSSPEYSREHKTAIFSIQCYNSWLTYIRTQSTHTPTQKPVYGMSVVAGEHVLFDTVGGIRRVTLFLFWINNDRKKKHKKEKEENNLYTKKKMPSPDADVPWIIYTIHQRRGFQKLYFNRKMRIKWC